ncbi:hypothetical protein [Rhodococcus sp. 11-3]|uniref:phage tail fiber protein n=1 Tax=Rhodococcus sp. 11-3 TaxID=2854796 RepID=UPI00203F07B7|nr:hypothetical protein [Rhodococcus sp. 11-3]
MTLTAPAATANAIADFIAARGNTFSLHTANPGAAGTANEASGGGYARQTGTYPAASGGETTTDEMVFDVSAGTYTHACRWNGSTLIEVIDNPDITISPAGEAKLTHKVKVNYTAPA